MNTFDIPIDFLQIFARVKYLCLTSDGSLNLGGDSADIDQYKPSHSTVVFTFESSISIILLYYNDFQLKLDA